MIFFAQICCTSFVFVSEGCVIFLCCAERLCDFFWPRGCVIFVCQEVAWFFLCQEVA